MPDSFNGRKLRPLIPRPATSTTAAATTASSCLNRIHGADLFGLNHHLGVFNFLGISVFSGLFGCSLCFDALAPLSAMTEQSNIREFNTTPVVVSSRWNPTPEQLRTLEELYRRGTRTPSAEQIQHITAQLRRYGKIEGKNVFYWFQNHKARERQKRRRQLEPDEQNRDVESTERKESGKTLKSQK